MATPSTNKSVVSSISSRWKMHMAKTRDNCICVRIKQKSIPSNLS